MSLPLPTTPRHGAGPFYIQSKPLALPAQVAAIRRSPAHRSVRRRLYLRMLLNSNSQLKIKSRSKIQLQFLIEFEFTFDFDSEYESEFHVGPSGPKLEFLSI